MTKTTVGADLLQALEVITELLVDNVGNDVQVLAVGHVLATVQEPSRDLELSRVLHDGDDTLELVRVELTGTTMGKKKKGSAARSQEVGIGRRCRMPSYSSKKSRGRVGQPS